MEVSMALPTSMGQTHIPLQGVPTATSTATTSMGQDLSMVEGHTTTLTVEDLITTHMPLLVLISTSMLPPSMVPIRMAPQEGLMATNMALAAHMAQPGDPMASTVDNHTTVPVEDIPALIINMQPAGDPMEVSTAQQGMLPTLTVPPGGPTATSTTHMAQHDHHMGNMGAGHTTTLMVEDHITTHMPLLVLISTNMLPPSMVSIHMAPQEGLIATNMALAAHMAQPGDPQASTVDNHMATTVPVEDIPALITNMQPAGDPMEVSMVPPSTDPTNMVPRGDPTTTSMAAIHMVPSDLMATTVLVGGTASSVEAVVISDNSGMASTAMTCTATLTEATSTTPPTSMEQPEHHTDSTELYLIGATTALLIHTAPQGTPTAPPETPMELLEIRMVQRGTPMAPPEIRMVPLAKTQPTARMEPLAGPTAVSTAPIRMPPQGGLTRAVSMGTLTELLGTLTAPPGTPMDLPGTPTVRTDLTRGTVLVRTAPPGDLTVPPG